MLKMCFICKYSARVFISAFTKKGIISTILFCWAPVSLGAVQTRVVLTARVCPKKYDILYISTVFLHFRIRFSCYILPSVHF